MTGQTELKVFPAHYNQSRPAIYWPEPELIACGARRVALFEELGCHVHAVDESLHDMLLVSDAVKDRAVSGFRNLVILIPTDHLFTLRIYYLVTSITSGVKDTPVWLCHWTSECDQQLEAGDGHVVANALQNSASFPLPTLNSSAVAGAFILKTLPMLAKMDKDVVLRSLVRFMQEIKGDGVLRSFRTQVVAAGFSRDSLEQAYHDWRAGLRPSA